MNQKTKPFVSQCPDTACAQLPSCPPKEETKETLTIESDVSIIMINGDKSTTKPATKHFNKPNLVEHTASEQSSESDRSPDDSEVAPLIKRLRHHNSVSEGALQQTELKQNPSLGKRELASMEDQTQAITRSATKQLQQIEHTHHPPENAGIPEDLSQPALPTVLQQRPLPPTSISLTFPNPIQERKDGGNPAEIVSPDIKVVTPNNGSLVLGHAAFPRPVDNNLRYKQLDNNNKIIDVLDI